MDSTKIVYVLSILICVIILQNTKANPCVDQIIKDGGMEFDFDSIQAFQYAYLKLNLKFIVDSEKAYLHHYLRHLFYAVKKYLAHENISIFSPLNWCKNSVTMNLSVERMECYNSLRKFGFKVRGKASSAFSYAYKNIIETMELDDISTKYYMYIFQTVLPIVVQTDAVGPIQYCQNFTDKICTSQITSIAPLRDISSSVGAFKYAYLNINLSLTDGPDQDILRQYLKSLIDETISIYDGTEVQEPLEWCMDNISTYFKKPNEVNQQSKCIELLKNSFFKDINNELSALEYGYYNIISKNITNKTIKDYYTYLLHKFLPIVGNSKAQSPLQYCERLILSIVPTSIIGQNYTVAYIPIHSGQHHEHEQSLDRGFKP